MPLKKSSPSPELELLTALTETVGKTGSAKGLAINNTLERVLTAAKVNPRRAQFLREYTLAVMEPLLEHADGFGGEPPVISYAELVAVLLAGALLVQSDRILHRTVS